MGKILGYGEITVANMTEPFTVMLTNEAQQFATDSNRKVTSAQSYYTDIIVIRGSQERTDYTIGNITSGSGITVSKSSKRVTFSVSADATIGADTGVIEIPITLDGQTVKKQFSWSCGKQGPQGVKGEDGISPKVSLSKSGNTTTISIVDATGTHTQTVKDGTNGTPGAAGKDGKTSYFHVKYSNDGGKTFTSNSGEDTGIYMGSYTDYTEADSTDVGKYTWIKVKGDKGDTGQKGQDGTSIKITSKSVTYQTSTSGTTAPTGTWSTTVPTVNNGQYLWTKTTVQYSDGNKTEAYSVSYKGTNGTNGTSVTVSKTEVTYQVSTSGTTAPTGTWSTTMPSCDQGQYLWTKTYVKYSDGKETTSYSVSYKGVDGEKFSWNLINNGKGNEKRGFFKNFSSVNITEGYGETTLTSKHNYIGIGLPGFVLSPRQYEVGKKVTWSYDIMYTKWDFPTGSNRQEYWMGQRYTNAASGETATGQWVGVTAHDLPVVGQNGCELNKWFHVEVTKTIPTQASSNVGHQEVINFYNSTDISATVTFRMKNVKLEYGDTATPWSPSQSDLEGRGVSQTVQYYLATSQASGVTSSTSGWSTDITTQKLTADKKYLWNCYQTKYSDGTSEPISTPKVIGVYGDKGTSTKIIRTGYKYTQNNIDTFSASGYSGTWDTADATTGLKVGDNVLLRVKNTTKGSDCLIFASITAIPSNYSLTCTSYGLIDNGADGQDGKNAKNLSITPSSQYFKSTDGGKTFAPNTITIKPTIQGEISFGKWQYSIDGGVSFADVVSGQKGLTVSNNVLTVSKDSSLYSDAVTMVTFRAVASDSAFYDTCSIAKIYDVSDIGDGRNLLTGVSSYTKDTPFEKTDSRADGWIVYQNIITSIELEAGKKYVLQAKTDGNWTANHDTNGQDPSKKLVALWLCSDTTNDFFDMRQGYAVFTPTVTAKYKLRVNQYSNGTDDYTIRLWDIKLEKGSSPTGWTPAPEDVQTAILSTKSEISDVSLKVDKNKQAIEQRVEKTTYEQDLDLVKGDISKANEGLNKWRYEIYPKSLFTDKPEDQSKISLDVFARNKNIIPTQSILLDDTKLGQSNYDDNYIGYAVTFVKMSEATKLETTFVHDDAGSFYLNGKLICTNGKNNFYSSATPDTVSCTLVKGWNCLEVVINEGAGSEGFKFGTVLSQLSTCQLMNCYYAMVTGRESQITNTLVQNTTDIEGVTTKVGKVTSVIGENGENFTSFKNDYSDFKQTMNGFKATVGQTYVTKDDFNGLEIGGRNLLWNSGTTTAIQNSGEWNAHGCTATAETRNNCLVSRVNSPWNGYQFNLKKIIERYNLVDGDILTYSIDVKMDEPIDILFVNNYYADNKGCTGGISTVNRWDGKYFTIGKWERLSFTFKITQDTLDKIATDTYRQGVRTAFEPVKATSEGKYVYFACPKLERGTKATDYTPALEDNEINGQNLVSNLSSNWEQGSVSYVANSTYASIKAVLATCLRTEDVFSVSGNVTISAGTSTNSSKEELNFYYVLFDVNKKAIGVPASGSEWQSLTSPKIINCGDAKYMAIILRWGSGSTVITPSNISQICLKIERGTSATPFTLAPEDVNGKIVNVETIANQTAKKFEWIVKGGDSSSNFTLTDRVADLVAERINFKGLVTFSGTTNLIENSNMMNGLANITSECKAIKVIDDSTYRKALVITPIAGERIFWGVANVWKANITYTVSFVAKSSVAGQKIKPSRSVADWGDEITLTTSYVKYTTRIKSTATADGGTLSFSFSNAIGDVTLTNVKLETGMNPTDWSPAPGDYITQASLVRNWTTNTTWINGGKIYTGSITADKIAANSITADKIATDAIKSRNYISSGGTQGSFLNLSDGSFQSPNLSWDSNGNLIAKNANLSGQITATKGSIGKYEITDQWLITGSGSTATGIGGNQAFWAGAEDSNSAPFRVGYDGKFVSSNADISGKITATEGKIGKYEITDTYLKTGSGSTCSGIGSDDCAFWAGGTNSKDSNFVVLYGGSVLVNNLECNDRNSNDALAITNGTLYIQSDNNSAFLSSTGFEFEWGGDYRILSVGDGVKCYRNLYATDFIADGWIYNAPGGHYTWKDRNDAYISCGNYNNTNNVYYYAGYHAFYVNGDSGSGMMYINTNGVTSRVGFTKTSDERIKKNFESFDDNIIDAYMNIEPVKYQLKQSSNDNYHFGFKAQHVDKVFSDYGDTYNESFDICTSRPIDPDKAKELYGVDDMTEEYGLRYDELIAPTTYMVQHIYKELESTKGELAKVKQEKTDLEVRLQAIEAKLGL